MFGMCNHYKSMLRICKHVVYVIVTTNLDESPDLGYSVIRRTQGAIGTNLTLRMKDHCREIVLV